MSATGLPSFGRPLSTCSSIQDWSNRSELNDADVHVWFPQDHAALTDAGWIAVESGIAGGADVILLPEIPFTIEVVCEYLRKRAATGKKFSMVVVAEGVKLPAMDASGKPFPAPRRIESTTYGPSRLALRELGNRSRSG